MYAVADLHFKKIVHLHSLFASMPQSTPAHIQRAIAETVFASDAASANTAVYAYTNRSIAYIVLQHGPKLLQLHLECTLARGSVAEVKLELERTLEVMIDSAKVSSQKIDKVGIAIYAENNRITAGRYEPFGELFLRRFRETIIGDALFALVPAVVSALYGNDFSQSSIAFGAGMLVILIWIVIEAKTLQKKVSYEDI
jgi:hypothetical protein